MSGALAFTAKDVVHRAWGDRRNAAKRLARITGGSERAAKDWLARAHAPSLENAIRLAAECDDIMADLIALIEQAKAQRNGR